MRLAAIAGTVLMATASMDLWAQEPTPDPRIIQAMHNGPISQFRVSADGSTLVSVAEDKTVRVWRAADLMPIQVIALPFEPGGEGAARAVALSPDGQIAYVGGWTGLGSAATAQSRSVVHELDVRTGRLLRQLPGPQGTVESLAVSPDGRRLAIGGSQGGLTVLERTSGQTLLSDPQYADRLVSVDFSVTGQLATSSYDGCLRIYDVGGRLIFRDQYPPPADRVAGRACAGAKLGGVRFSPDGRQIALGLQDRAELLLVDAGTQRLRRLLKPADSAQLNLCCMAWRHDSSSIHIYGRRTQANGQVGFGVFRYRGEADGVPRLALEGQGKIHHSGALPDGGLILATDRPGLTRFDPEMRETASLRSSSTNLQTDWQHFQTDRTGRRIRLGGSDGAGSGGTSAQSFDLDGDLASILAPTSGGDTIGLAPADRGGLVRIETELGEASEHSGAKANGHPIGLKRYQQIWSWASHASRPVAALGTNWSVALVDANGRLLWETNLSAPAVQTILSVDGRWLIAGLGDGTVRWFDAQSGSERLGLFLHDNGQDWIAWRPDGFYASSPVGDQTFGWAMNRSDGQAPDLLRAAQFERTLYQPSMVRAALDPEGARSQTTAVDLGGMLRSLAAPRIEVAAAALTGAASQPHLRLDFTARSTGRPITDLGVYLDGIPVLGREARTVAPTEGDHLIRQLDIVVPRSFRSIRIEAQTEASLGVVETATAVVVPAAPPRPGTLWVVAIGVRQVADLRGCSKDGRCADPGDMALPNAPTDATAIAKLLATQQGRAFQRVETLLLTDDAGRRPDKAGIVAALTRLEQARPEDTVLVFLASHGELSGSGSGEYYFFPMDASSGDIGRLTAAPTPAGASGQVASKDRPAMSSLLSSDELFGLLKHVPGRRLLAIDTCRSAGADGRSNPFSLAKRSAAAQIGVLAASAGNEQSYEDEDESSHGAFTKALLEALSGTADVDQDGQVTLGEAFDYVGQRVQKIVARLNTKYRSDVRQTPTLTASPLLKSATLTRP